MRTLLFAFIIAITTLYSHSASAKIVKSAKCSSTGSIGLIVDSIDFRGDCTRIYGKLTGTPHIANRIDNLILKGSMSHKAVKSTDIDGIDLKRWFQWEDEAIIPVEIDFPSCSSKRGRTTVSVTSPKGACTWVITIK